MLLYERRSRKVIGGVEIEVETEEKVEGEVETSEIGT